MPDPETATPPLYDVLLDGSHPDAAGFCLEAGRVATVAPGSKRTMLDAWRGAVGAARQRQRHLLVVLGGLPAGVEIVPPLLAALASDPMLGTAQPRFADARTDGIWPLPPIPEAGAQLSRACLQLIPGTVITAELLAACLLIRREVVAAMEPPGDFGSIAAALSCELTRARRRGFRNVVVNRVVIPSALGPAQLYPILPPEDAARLEAAFPDRALAAAENRDSFERQLEPLLSAAYPGPGRTRRLLLDCRGLDAMHNGTSQCMLGMLDGFAALDPPWEIHVESRPEAASFHQLAARYERFVHHSGPAEGAFAAVLLPNQPWTVDHIAHLHRRGFVVACNILDTISWDIIYAGPYHLDRTWRLAARHSDVLTFISAFSRDRFRRRIGVGSGVREAVVHLSLAADEQLLPHLPDRPTGDHVLLFGNAYDHKGLDPAVRLLAAAFPFQRFVVLGAAAGVVSPNVELVPSGGLEPQQVHRLVATARAMVYPSFYEGFGLPVLEGLAYGRPVLVRSSPLWAEIAAHSWFDGRLIEFEDDTALIEALGGLLAGSPAPGLLFGLGLAEGQTPQRWRDAAAAQLGLIEERLADPDLRHWHDRAESLRLAGF